MVRMIEVTCWSEQPISSLSLAIGIHSRKLHPVFGTQLTTSDFLEKIPSVRAARASHFAGNLTV